MVARILHDRVARLQKVQAQAIFRPSAFPVLPASIQLLGVEKDVLASAYVNMATKVGLVATGAAQDSGSWFDFVLSPVEDAEMEVGEGDDSKSATAR